MPTSSKFQRWTPSERAAMTRSEVIVAIQICERGMESRRSRSRGDWPDREDFWEIHGEWCALFSELYKKDAALIARWDAALPAGAGTRSALPRGKERNNNGNLF